MSDKPIRDCYAAILKDVINAIKEDPMLQSSLTPEQIETLEEVVNSKQKWKKNLERKGITNDNYASMGYMDISNFQGGYESGAHHPVRAFDIANNAFGGVLHR
jgi:hypothetical protein